MAIPSVPAPLVPAPARGYARRPATGGIKCKAGLPASTHDRDSIKVPERPRLCLWNATVNVSRQRAFKRWVDVLPRPLLKQASLSTQPFSGTAIASLITRPRPDCTHGRHSFGQSVPQPPASDMPAANQLEEPPAR